jgi:hypothetical protein
MLAKIMKLKKSWMTRMATWMLAEAADKRTMKALRAENQRLRSKYTKKYKHQKSKALQGIMALRMKEAAKRQKMHAEMAAYKKKEANMAVVKIKHVKNLYEKLDVHLKNKIARAKKEGRDE